MFLIFYIKYVIIKKDNILNFRYKKVRGAQVPTQRVYTILYSSRIVKSYFMVLHIKIEKVNCVP